MQTIKVLTPQNVQIEYAIASLGDRILAYIIDSLIAVAYIILLLLLFGSIADQIFNSPPGLVSVFFILILPILLYHLLCELYMNGQSVGKRQMNIQVVSLDGGRPTLGAYLIRWLMRIIDMPFYGMVAIITIIVTGKGQRLGDLLAGTTVIKLQSVRSLATNPVKLNIDEEHLVVYSSVSNLADEEVALIDEALTFNVTEGNSGPANLLAQKLAEKMGITLSEPPIKFLYQVKKDYHFVMSQK